jgi:ribosome-associated protein
VRTDSLSNEKRQIPDVPPDSGDRRNLALTAVAAALEKHALEPVLLDVRELASYADYILVVSGRSDRQVQAIAEGVLEALARDRVKPIGTEGLKQGQWTLLDFGDLIVHVFYHPVRDFYDLESFWVDAPRIRLEIPPEARIGVDDVYK